jgi:hypothetical protein
VGLTIAIPRSMTTQLVLRFTSRQLAEACLMVTSELLSHKYSDLVDADLAASTASTKSGACLASPRARQDWVSF